MIHVTICFLQPYGEQMQKRRREEEEVEEEKQQLIDWIFNLSFRRRRRHRNSEEINERGLKWDLL